MTVQRYYGAIPQQSGGGRRGLKRGGLGGEGREGGDWEEDFGDAVAGGDGLPD